MNAKLKIFTPLHSVTFIITLFLATIHSHRTASIKAYLDGQRYTLLNSASPTEFVGLFISITAFRLTLKCHCYSSRVVKETIKKHSPKPNL